MHGRRLPAAARALAAGLLLALVACAGAPTPQVSRPQRPFGHRLFDAAPRTPIARTERPPVLGTFSFDYGALPLMSDETPARPVEFTIAKDERGPIYRVRADDFAGELQIRNYVGYTSPRHMPTASPCINQEVAVPALLRGLRRSTWRDEHVEYADYRGTFSSASCSGAAATARTVVAPALVPGLLYAFRRAVGAAEELVLIGPYNHETFTTALPPPEDKPPQSMFAVLPVVTCRGSSGSALMHVTVTDFLFFERLRPQPMPPSDVRASGEPLSIGVDVLWAEDDAPQVVVVVASENDFWSTRFGFDPPPPR